MIRLLSVVFFLVTLTLWTAPWWPQALWWVASLFQLAPLWILLVPAATLALATGARKKKWLTVLNLVSAGLITAMMGLSVPVAKWVASDTWLTSLKLRVITVNLGGDVDTSSLAYYFNAISPDVILFQESSLKLMQKIAPRDLAHRKLQSNLGIASRYPVSNSELKTRRALGEYGGFVARFEITHEDTALQIFNVHLETPREGIEAIMREGPRAIPVVRKVAEQQEVESLIASEWVASHDPVLVAGDFNMPVTSPLYRRYWSQLGNGFSSTQFGFGNTKFTRWHGARIDHVLFDTNWKAVAAHVGENPGGDHRPVVVDLILNAP